METSRDDFVIAIRSAFLKKETKQRFSLLGLIFFSIIFLVLGSLNFKVINFVKIGIKEALYRASFVVSIPEDFIRKKVTSVDNHLSLYEENKKNIAELESLRAKDLINEFIILENQRLKRVIDDYLIESDETIAKVIGDKESPFLKSLIINKGSKHNVELGMAAYEKNYLIGKVIEVNYVSSRILLLSDINSKIPVIIEPGNIQSILSGTGQNFGKVEYLKKVKKIKKSSVVYTSGSAGLFKTGIPVGRINDGKTVEFFSDFSQLTFIKIVGFKKEEK